MQGVVVSTGGGTPCYHHGIEEINSHGLSIFLDMSPATIAHRLLHARQKRPLVMDKTGKELIRYIEKKLAERLTCYEKAQNITALAGEIEAYEG